MGPTLYASFEDASAAEKAAGALLDHGARAEDISIIATEEYGRSKGVPASTMYDPPTDRTRAAANIGPDEYNTMTVDRETGEVDPMDRDNSPVTRDRTEDVDAESGISTTTGEDAASGAGKGAAIGAGVGIIAGLAALIVPPFGLVAGGGALATALAGAAGATAAGAIAGGVFGYLKDQGVPEHVARSYHEVYERGGAILSVHVPSGDVDEAKAESILNKYEALNVGTYGVARTI